MALTNKHLMNDFDLISRYAKRLTDPVRLQVFLHAIEMEFSIWEFDSNTGKEYIQPLAYFHETDIDDFDWHQKEEMEKEIENGQWREIKFGDSQYLHALLSYIDEANL